VLGGTDEIAFVLAIGVVHEDNELAGLQIFENVFDSRKGRLRLIGHEGLRRWGHDCPADDSIELWTGIVAAPGPFADD
jgi:hypothetical protein